MQLLVQALRYLLVELIGASFTAFFNSAINIAKVTPLIIAYVALIVFVTVAYLSSANFLLGGIRQTVPGLMLNVWGWVMPSNAVPCLMALYGAKIAAWSFRQFRNVLDFKARSVVDAAVQIQKRNQ